METKPIFNYTGYGWEGGKYRTNQNLSITEIAKEIRKELKAYFPKCIFSVVCQKYSGGRSLHINLMHAPFNPFINPESKSEQFNHYCSDKESKIFTPNAVTAMKTVTRIANAFNFDDSDGMIDYSHTNFYLHLSVGKWDKPFIKD